MAYNVKLFGYATPPPLCLCCGEQLTVATWDEMQIDGPVHAGEADGGVCVDLRTHSCGSTVGRKFRCKRHTRIVDGKVIERRFLL